MDWSDEELDLSRVPRIAKDVDRAPWTLHEIPPPGLSHPYPGPTSLMAHVARQMDSQGPQAGLMVGQGDLYPGSQPQIIWDEAEKARVMAGYRNLWKAILDPSRLPDGEDDPDPFPDPAHMLKSG